MESFRLEEIGVCQCFKGRKGDVFKLLLIV